jgi:hypothetical protein
VHHAAINRLTGGTAQPEGGTLFSIDQAYYDKPVRFDVWTLSPEPAETVARWFEDGLIGGYGRRASTGLGHLELIEVAEAELPAPEQPNAGVLLGPAVPQPGDPARGFFHAGIRCGRVGGDFAIGDLPGGSVQRQKRPVRCLLRGSLLHAEPPPAHVGRLVAGVHELEAIRHYGLAPLLPCRLDPALLNDPLLAPAAAGHEDETVR